MVRDQEGRRFKSFRPDQFITVALIASAGQVRLASLYDIASILPYPDIDIQKARSSMKIGKEYRLRNIEPLHLSRFGYQHQRLCPRCRTPQDERGRLRAQR
jgi:hypothetical protein